MSALPDNSTPEIPGWEIVDLLGQGGMGAVYRARSKTLSQHVALKVIDPVYAGNQAFRRCFMREISTAVTLHHPHILPILNFSPDPDSGPLYFVTPLVGEEGRRSLADLLTSDGRLDPRLAAALLAQVADALAYAHSQSTPLIHRDVTPSNILLKSTRSDSCHALLADFGIAFPGSQEARDAVTDPDSLIPAAGKPQYMAPEQFDEVEFGPMSPQTDLYQLGVVAYECLIGELPFQETNAIRLSDCHRRTAAPRLSEAQCPDPRWRRLVAELLAKRAEDRPESAASVRNRLFDMARETHVVPERPSLTPEEESGDTSSTKRSSKRGPTTTREHEQQPTPRSERGDASKAAPARRRAAPPTLVQPARSDSPAAPANPARSRRDSGRWVLLGFFILLAASVLAFQFRAELLGLTDEQTPLALQDPPLQPPIPADEKPEEPTGDEPATEPTSEGDDSAIIDHADESDHADEEIHDESAEDRDEFGETEAVGDDDADALVDDAVVSEETDDEMVREARRLEAEIEALTQSIETALEKGERLRAQVQEIADRTIGNPHQQTRLQNIGTITELCADWEREVEDPVVERLDTLEDLRSQLEENTASTLDTHQVAQSVADYKAALEGQNPNPIRLAVLADHHRQRREQTDD